MPLNSTQLQTLKSDIAANSATITFNGAPVAINALPSNADADAAIATYYNQPASPDYWVWRGDVTRVEVYTGSPTEGTSWDWTGFKNQSVTEQNAWFEMFMGGKCNFGNLNNRKGALAIFGTAGAGGANRTHIFNVVRRLATRIEKLFAVVVTSPPANTGNNSGDARGATTNPDVLGFSGSVTGNDVSNARNLP